MVPLNGLGLAGYRPGASESAGPEVVVCSAALPPCASALCGMVGMNAILSQAWAAA